MTTAEAFYRSAYQQPLLLAAPSLLWLAYLLARRQPRHMLWRYCAAFTALSLLDAVLTSESVQAPTAVAVLFVILGDYRVFLWLERRGRRPWLTALALSLIVPVVSAGLMKLLPEGWAAEPRVTFLTYELLFVAVFATHCTVRRHWGKLAAYVIAYYLCWATADIALLATDGASTWAWSLRILANVMYYVGWTPWVYLMTREERGENPQRA